MKVAIIEKAAPGGKLVKTHQIQNYPGINSIGGADLAYQMYDHATTFGAEYLYGDVVDVVDEKEYKRVICEDGTEYTAKAIIVATGTVERMLQIPHEEEMIGRGVSYCAVCDGSLFRNKNIVVVTKGMTAKDSVEYLYNITTNITVLDISNKYHSDEPALLKISSQDEPREDIVLFKCYLYSLQ